MERNFSGLHLVSTKLHLVGRKSAQDVHSIAIKGEHEQPAHCLHIPALVRASNTVLCPPPLSYNIVKRWQPLPLRSCHTETNSYRLAGERKEESSVKLFLDLNSSVSSSRLLKIGYGFQKHPDTLARNCLCEELSER